MRCSTLETPSPGTAALRCEFPGFAGDAPRRRHCGCWVWRPPWEPCLEQGSTAPPLQHLHKLLARSSNKFWLIRETKSIPALEEKKNPKKNAQMRALFTRSRGELFMGDTAASRWAPRRPAGAAQLRPAPAGPPLPPTAAPRPRPRRAAPPPPTQDTLRENGLPQGEHRTRRCPARRGLRPSHREPSPECRAGRGAAARPAWRSRVPGGGGQPARPDRALRDLHSPAALNGQDISPRHSRASSLSPEQSRQQEK